MGKYIMALDAGTTSNRCILFNEKGERREQKIKGWNKAVKYSYRWAKDE